MSRPKDQPVVPESLAWAAFLARHHLKEAARQIGFARTQARLAAESDRTVRALDKLAAEVAKVRTRLS